MRRHVGGIGCGACGRASQARTRAASGLRPAGHYGLPARSLADGGRLDDLRKARPGAGRRTPRWRAGRRPRSRERTRHTKNNGCATWRAISLAICGGKEGVPLRRGKLRRTRRRKETGRRSVGCLTIESERDGDDRKYSPATTVEKRAFPLIPAQAGIQHFAHNNWVPAGACTRAGEAGPSAGTSGRWHAAQNRAELSAAEIPR
jgi:hypothetical protein